MRVKDFITMSILLTALCMTTGLKAPEPKERVDTTSFYIQKPVAKNNFDCCDFSFAKNNSSCNKWVDYVDSIWKSLNVPKESKVVKPHKAMNITKSLYEGSTKFLDNFLGDAKLKGKGAQFLKAQEKYGINAVFLIAIARLESGCGKSKLARQNNNFGGMRGKNGWLKFNTVDEGIDALAANLKKRYVDDGLVTIEDINKRYASDKNWADRIVDNMNVIYDDSQFKVLKFD